MRRGGPIRRKKADPLARRLKDLCRFYVVLIRDRETCQRCGSRGITRGVQWCHVLSRKAPSLVCVPVNSLALCAACHFWFDANKGKLVAPGEGLEWWIEKFPDRALALGQWQRSRRKKAEPLSVQILWFEQHIQAAGYPLDMVKGWKCAAGGSS